MPDDNWNQPLQHMAPQAASMCSYHLPPFTPTA